MYPALWLKMRSPIRLEKSFELAFVVRSFAVSHLTSLIGARHRAHVVRLRDGHARGHDRCGRRAERQHPRHVLAFLLLPHLVDCQR